MGTLTLCRDLFLRRFSYSVTRGAESSDASLNLFGPGSLVIAVVCSFVLLLSGCGGGGYPGGGITAVSQSSIVMDAGQSVLISATVSGNYSPAWAVSGAACSGSGCGTISAASGASVTYTAPAGITAPMQVALVVSIAGTKNQQTVSITVNPDPAFSGTPPTGIVGVAYSTTISLTGGTTPVTASLASGSLPPGLNYDPATGIISGTPTTVGAYAFVLHAVDSSVVPFTVTANESITIVNPPPPLTLSGGPPPEGEVGIAYTTAFSAAGGVTPYAWSASSGTLPAGLAISPTAGVIAGTPTAAGTSNFTVQVQDATLAIASSPETIQIAPALALTGGPQPTAFVGTSYSTSLAASGGVGPFAWSILSGSLPSGLTISPTTGLISGTPSAAGNSTFTVKVSDSLGATASAAASIAVLTPLSITSTLPNGKIGVAYSSTITATGGTTPYACSLTTGTLPAGLTLTGCVVSGTPTTAGSATVTVHVADTGTPVQTANSVQTIVIAPATLAITSTLPNGQVGVVYSSTITATGGTTPYACSLTTGTLPAGLTLTGCVVSGTPTTAGSATVTVHVADTGTPVQTANSVQTIVIAPATLAITSTLPNGQVGVVYSSTITATGGTTPYACSITSGALPTGLTLTGCVVSGTPTTAGSATVNVHVADTGSPVQTANSSQTIVIAPATLAITSTLPNGQVGVVYSSTITATGGTTPYACSITSGALPTGLTLTGCVVSGTPTTAGSATVNVHVADTGSPVQTADSSQTIVIAPATLAITSTLPNGQVGVAYNSAITATGGTTPYACSISSGTLPAGLTLTACMVSGTPTTAGSSTVTVTVTDAGSPMQTANANQTIVIADAALTLTTTSMPDGTVNVPYSAPIGISGGSSPYACSITTGTLPAGLTLNGCTVSGTPTTAGPETITVHVTDAQSPAGSVSGQETIVINPAALAITSTLPTGTVGVSYSTTITATGGTTPYACSISAGSLPTGLTLSGCTISGTPTTPGSSPITITVTDSSSPVKTANSNQTLIINPSGTLSLAGTPPNGVVNQAYTYAFVATGGTPGYTYALTAGAVPAGLTLQPDGTLSGTPTTPGASSFTVTVTDSASPQATASLPVVLLIEYAPGVNDAELDGPYAYLFQGYDDVALGLFAYHTATIGSFTADGTGGINLGELDSNHQTSNPSGTTVPTQNFLGTYVVNADNRGFITITTLKDDGTTDKTFTYAISLKAPVLPATISTQGSLIEYDNNSVAGTKGSGTLLAQTPGDFAAGLNGHYVFGLSGDTPCLISCTLGAAHGPVATVGVFGTDGAGNVTSGTADANIASLNFANAPLDGSYQGADANGRLDLQLTNSSMSDGLYPTDFAVYLVNANQAFIMSVDKHSDYVLLAGTAQLQSTTPFTDASINGPFIGYENAQVNPGLLGKTLQDVLNYSQATVFRASGNGSGSCTTTNVDSGGLTSLVNSLSGLTGTQQNNLITALLGSYDATGTSTCTVGSDGRGTFNYPSHPSLISLLLGLLGLPTAPPDARVYYLASQNTGYFLETGYAGLGQIEPQTGAPFSNATLNGTYVVDNLPGSSVAGINSAGYYAFDGAGNVTFTTDENVGVGTVNLLQLGVSGTTTYTLSNSNSNATASAAGRYVLLDTTTVIYAISPGRFVVIDTNPLSTSPGISLLY